MVEEGKKNDAKLWLKSGLGIGVISIGGYLLGFAYESGYASYFGIPVQLIKLNLINIFLSITGLFVLLWFLFQIINLGYMIFSGRTGVISRAILNSAPSILFFSAAFFIYVGTPSWHIYKWTILWPVFSLFGRFVLPLITQRGKGTYYQKLEAKEQSEDRTQSKTLWGLITKGKGGAIVYILIFAIWWLYSFANWIGQAEAQKQNYFFVIREPKPLVVLRIYGDRFVCAPFDLREGTVEKAFYILDAPQRDGLWLDWQLIGRLKPVYKQVSETSSEKTDRERFLQCPVKR